MLQLQLSNIWKRLILSRRDVNLSIDITSYQHPKPFLLFSDIAIVFIIEYYFALWQSQNSRSAQNLVRIRLINPLLRLLGGELAASPRIAIENSREAANRSASFLLFFPDPSEVTWDYRDLQQLYITPRATWRISSISWSCLKCGIVADWVGTTRSTAIDILDGPLSFLEDHEDALFSLREDVTGRGKDMGNDARRTSSKEGSDGKRWVGEREGPGGESEGWRVDSRQDRVRAEDQVVGSNRANLHTRRLPLWTLPGAHASKVADNAMG